MTLSLSRKMQVIAQGDAAARRIEENAVALAVEISLASGAHPEASQ